MRAVSNARSSSETLAGRPDGSRSAGTWQGFQRTKSYDLLAAAPLFVWYCLSAGRLVPALGEGVAPLSTSSLDLHRTMGVLAQAAALVLILMSMMFLLLRNPASAKSTGILPRLVAGAGTYLGVAVVWLPGSEMSTTQSFSSLVLIVAGTAFTIYAMFHLGRSFSIMPEARQLVTNGPYAFSRHPLYLGEAVSTIGLMVQFLSPAAVAITAVQLAFQVWRMTNEERVLARQFPEYASYAARTPALIPGVCWK